MLLPCHRVVVRRVVATNTVLIALMLFLVAQDAVLTRHDRRGVPEPAQTTRARAHENWAALPLAFEANRGQTASQVRYLARSDRYVLFLTAAEAVIALPGSPTTLEAEPSTGLGAGPSTASRTTTSPTPAARVLRMSFVGGNKTPAIEGLEEQPTKVHYYRGRDPAKWQTNVPTYGRVTYREMYPGVDVVYYGNRRALEFDLVLAPNVAPDVIRLAFDGADELDVAPDGALVLGTAAGQVRLRKPGVYQEISGTRQPVECDYVILPQSQVGFRLASYDATRPLVIDPYVEVYLTYVGGNNDENLNAGDGGIAVDAQGNAYVAGGTNSWDFPAPDSPPIGEDAFVTKLNPAGSGPPLWSVLVGGGNTDAATAIAVGTDGHAYVAGNSQSLPGDFPDVNGYPTFAMGGSNAAFLVKLDGGTGALLYGTLLGGGVVDEAYGVAVDPDGNAYVTGFSGGGITAKSPDPAGPYKDAPTGSQDYFVAKIDPDQFLEASLVYFTYLGSAGTESSGNQIIAVDALGFAYVTGAVPSIAGFDVVNYLPESGPGAFVVKFNQAGSALVYSTFLGHTAAAEGTGIAVDVDGTAYVTGKGATSSFVTVQELTQSSCVAFTNFLVKLEFDQNTSILARTFATCLDATSDDVAVDVDGAKRMHLGDLLIDLAKPAAERLVYADVGPGGVDVAVDSFCNAYVTGWRDGFPPHPAAHGPLGPFQTMAAGRDAYAAKVGGRGPLAYVTLFNHDKVTVIDTASNTPADLDPGVNGVQSAIQAGIGDGPFGVAVRPSGDRVYVTNRLGNSISIIDTSTHIATLKSVGFQEPTGVAVSPDGAWVFVANHGSNSVAILDSTGALANIAPANPVPLPAGSKPFGVAVRDINGTLTAFVANEGIPHQGSLSVVTLVNGVATPTTPVSGLSGPRGIAVMSGPSPMLYVANGQHNVVTVFKAETLEFVKDVPVGDNPTGVAISPDDTRVYVTNFYPLGASGGNTVSVIETATNDPVDFDDPSTPLVIERGIEVGGGPYGLAVHPDGSRVYVANSSHMTCPNCPPPLVEHQGTPPGDDVGHTVSVIDVTKQATVVSLPYFLMPPFFPGPTSFGPFIAPLSSAFDPGCVPGQPLMQLVSLDNQVRRAPLDRAAIDRLIAELARVRLAIERRQFAQAEHGIAVFVDDVQALARGRRIPIHTAETLIGSAQLVVENLPAGVGDVPDRPRSRPPGGRPPRPPVR